MSFSDVPGNYLLHILIAIQNIRAHIDGRSKSEVAADRKTEAAVERPAEDWRKIRGLGNILRHAYEGVDIETLWRIIQIDLPHMESSVRIALAQVPEKNP